MNSFTIEISNPAELPLACEQLLEFAGPSKILAFNGEMGVGKTTFIKALCKSLGSQDDFSSPTYSIVNEYRCPGGKIFHFDLYRLKTLEELLDLGFEEYVSGKDYCFIEWPELASPLLPVPYLSIVINQDQNNRYLSARFIKE